MIDLATLPFIQAKHYHVGRLEEIGLIAIHDMEAARTMKTALHVAQWFAGPQAPEASCGYCVDAKTIVQCVHDEDTSWHAPHINANGIGIELAGYYTETADEWLDDYGLEELDLAAQLVAALCVKHSIPVRFVDAAGILAGEKGITTHAEATKAYDVKGGHVDPGSGFPMAWFIDYIGNYMPSPSA